jgi:hypothetical protein
MMKTILFVPRTTDLLLIRGRFLFWGYSELGVEKLKFGLVKNFIDC